ncbi:MAG: hypothetical protein QOI29_723, partial [Mycobacterium sp.]|nr:hypothetical protein [Mycobacterium sp.]
MPCPFTHRLIVFIATPNSCAISLIVRCCTTYSRY